jgi:hypothetical protein
MEIIVKQKLALEQELAHAKTTINNLSISNSNSK